MNLSIASHACPWTILLNEVISLVQVTCACLYLGNLLSKVTQIQLLSCLMLSHLVKKYVVWMFLYPREPNELPSRKEKDFANDTGFVSKKFQLEGHLDERYNKHPLANKKKRDFLQPKM